MMLAKENRPPISATAKANAQLAAAAVLALLAWHVAVWVCSDGLSAAALPTTVWALLRFDPFDLGNGVTTAGTGAVVGVWAGLLLAICAALVWVVAHRHRGRAEKGMTTRQALAQRTGAGPRGHHDRPLRPLQRSAGTGAD